MQGLNSKGLVPFLCIKLYVSTVNLLVLTKNSGDFLDLGKVRQKRAYNHGFGGCSSAG